LLQALLWSTIGSETRGGSCSAANRALSFAVLLVVCGLPLWFCLVSRVQRLLLFPLPAHYPSAPAWLGFARRALGLHGRWLERWPRRTVPVVHDKFAGVHASWCLIFLCATAAYFALRLAGIGSAGEEDESLLGTLLGGPVCTTRGDRGHQVWPMVVFRHWSLRALAALSYVAVAGGFNLLPRPSLVFALFRMCGLPLVALLYLTLGDEWGSVWCWTASCTCALYLAEPGVMQRHHILQRQALRPGEAGHAARLRGGAPFLLAWGHVRTEMRPWVIPRAKGACCATAACATATCAAAERVEEGGDEVVEEVPSGGTRRSSKASAVRRFMDFLGGEDSEGDEVLGER